MPTYAYTAKDIGNKTVKGTINADNLQAAKTALEEINLKPEEIHEATGDERNETDNAQTDSDMFFKPSTQSPKQKGNDIYFPIVDTLRLYAGWLLVGYLVAYFLGSYQITRNLPFEIPYVSAFLYSNIILKFTLVCFLFLLASSIQKLIKGKVFSAIVLTILCVGIFVFVHINI
ncbi:hypothetical protein KJ652_01570 [Patescibacteria group bacterium]|nr:hypothetical protein [Patescibacteria group bacterium]MBU1123257.1 hypothetical protein [Patescibacteria group bacterium]